MSAANQSNYFSLQLRSGENIFAQLTRSTDPSEVGFSPILVIEGPGIHNSSGNLPASVEIPGGYGYTIVPSSNSSAGAVYDAFGPESFYMVSEYSSTATSNGTYYLVVFSNSTGHYALSVGQAEEYTITQWITLPFSLISVYLWLGESLPMVLAPIIITFVTGMTLAYYYFRKKDISGFVNWPGTAAGIIFIGTGFSTIFQMVVNGLRTGYAPGMFATLSLAVLPMAIGVPVFLISTRKGGMNPMGGVIMALLGVAGLFSLVGYIIAPVLALTSMFYAIAGKELE